jgi:16S rRNA processing protein RimM
MRLFALGPDANRREVELEELWPHKGNLVFKLKGVDSINDAETFLRCELQIPLAERAQLEPGEAYISDLVGCEVTDAGRKIGTVTAVQFGAGEAPLLVVRDGKQEHLLPLAETFLEAPGGGIALDVTHKMIRMHLPEGLLEINAPLSTKERAAQKKSQDSEPKP